MLVQLTSYAKPAWAPSQLGHNWASLTRAFRYNDSNCVLFLSCLNLFLVIMFVWIFQISSKAAASDVIGIDLGTTNSCVAVMEGKVYM